MGITQLLEAQDDGPSGEIDPALHGGASQRHQAPVAAMVSQSHKDPLWQLAKKDAIRLCRTYDEEMGLMYPMLDIERVIDHAQKLFDFTQAATKTGLMNPDGVGADQLEGNDVNILKMVLASALMVEGGGQSPLGRALYESCRQAFECTLTDPVEVKGLSLLVIVVCFSVSQGSRGYS